MTFYGIIELVIALVGAVTGVTSLWLHYRRYKRERPILTYKVIDSFYEVNKLEENTNKIRFHFDILIDNSGDKSTTITEINMKYRLSKGFIAIEDKILDPPKQVNANSSTVLSIDFEVTEGPDRQITRYISEDNGIFILHPFLPIRVLITIIHTHGKWMIPETVYHEKDFRRIIVKSVRQSWREDPSW